MTPQTWTVPADFGAVNTIEVLAGGGAGILNSAGGAGSMEPMWTSTLGATAGPGSGGGGGAANVPFPGSSPGGDAGGYGAGGGGGSFSAGAGGAGTQGGIFITYTPVSLTPRHQIRDD